MKKVVLILTSLIFAGCTTTEIAQPQTPVVTTATSANLNLVKDADGLPVSKISMDIKGVDSKQALKMIFDEGHVPYTMAPNLKSRIVELNLVEVPWREALNQLVASQNYDYSVNNGVVHVKMAPKKKMMGKASKRIKK